MRFSRALNGPAEFTLRQLTQAAELEETSLSHGPLWTKLDTKLSGWNKNIFIYLLYNKKDVKFGPSEISSYFVFLEHFKKFEQVGKFRSKIQFNSMW